MLDSSKKSPPEHIHLPPFNKDIFKQHYAATVKSIRDEDEDEEQDSGCFRDDL